MEDKAIKCPWCEQTTPASGIKVARAKNEYGTVIERRCPKCGKVLAAYLESEGDFLPRIRTFPQPGSAEPPGVG